MKQATAILISSVIALCLLPGLAQAAKIKDLAQVNGVRDNQLMGFGLIGGLAGTGDDPKSAPYTAEAIANMLASFGMSVEPGKLKVKNFAAVMVTAELPAFISEGDRLDVTVSSIGSAKSLEGGTLYQTLLRGADGQVYAVAQGELSLGGTIGGGGGGRDKKHPTLARIPEGALVEREVASTVSKEDGRVELNLKDPDFTTASTIAEALNSALGAGTAEAADAGKVLLRAPAKYALDQVKFLAMVENVEVSPGIRAKVVINERTGTLVIGNTVEILPVVVTHNGMTLSFGKRIGAQDSEDDEAVTSPGEEMTGSTTAEEVAAGLAAMSLSAGDVIAVFQAIEASGALLGELEMI